MSIAVEPSMNYRSGYGMCVILLSLLCQPTLLWAALNDSDSQCSSRASSYHVATDGTYFYRSGYNATSWTGSLVKLQSNDASPIWDAGEVLTRQATASAVSAANPYATFFHRNIYTAISQQSGAIQTILFEWDSLTDEQKAIFDKSPTTGKRDALGKDRVSYLRGERSKEVGRHGGVFRTRYRLLGDILNSNPVYVGNPSSIMQGNGYQLFHQQKQGRMPVVYVGANDGMLHAFSAVDGMELFAYIPNALLPDLNFLTNPHYVHRSYVDGMMTASEAQVRGQWRTVLASGMGEGANGIFVLDVSEPNRFSEGLGALWEFTEKHDSDMGNMSHLLSIAKFKVGVSEGQSVYKYFVVASGGVVEKRKTAALFLLSLDKEPGEKWVLGKNYYKFKTPAVDNSLSNGLGAPALVAGNDGAIRYVYAGDLQGNLWRFNFTGKAPWSNARSGNIPLFTAKGIHGTAQSITQQPQVVFAPGGYLILFGTGKPISDLNQSPESASPQSFYAIYDTTSNADVVTNRNQLASRTLAKVDSKDDMQYKIYGDRFGYSQPGNSRKGWYIDFVEPSGSGNKSIAAGITSALVSNGRVFFNVFMPGSACSLNGSAYELDALSGLPVTEEGQPVSGGAAGRALPPGWITSPILFQGPVETAGKDKRKAGKGYAAVNVGNLGNGEPNVLPIGEEPKIPIRAGRYSWREVSNYQEIIRSMSR